ncbi:MAG: ATP-binding protein [Bacteriovoracaceae bacterium]|nr:ATP-binding protein [Bacteriovoracaceae bacterium]
MKKEKVLLSWAGGKESAVCLFELKSPEFKIKGLISVATESDMRLSHSGIRLELVKKQAESLEIPLTSVVVGPKDGTGLKSKLLDEELEVFKKGGGQGVAFGENSSADLRQAHELLLQRGGLNLILPVWKWKQQEVLRVFLGLGFKAIVTAVDLQKLPATFVGRNFDQEFIDTLPSNIDPCGENGEFYTFVYDGPFFQKRIELKPGDRFEKNGYIYQDYKDGTHFN